MKLIVGLGNPGKQYENTRHNMGYLAVDAFAEMASADFDREGFKGVYSIVKNPAFSETIILLKPTTFMNLSGESVRAMMDYYRIDIEDLIVIYDDMDLPEGKIRLREAGSAGSHNGMKNIVQHLGSDQFKRIRIGIGEPPHSGIDYVLTKPTGESLVLIQEAIHQTALAIRDILLHDFAYAMNHYNQRSVCPTS